MLAVGAALVAAVAFALAAVLQQREAVAVPADDAGHLSMLYHLVHRPMWVVGGLVAALAAALHVFALSQAPLVRIQPLGAATPVFAVLLRSAFDRTRPLARDLIGSGAVGLGLAGLVLGIQPYGSASGLGLFVTVVLVVVGAGAVLAGLAAGWWLSGVPRAFCLALGAGTALGLVSALVRVLLLAVAGQRDTVPVLLLAITAGVGFVVFGQVLLQTAYQTGRLALVLATQTIVDPLTASAVGIGLLHEPARVAVLEFAVGGPLLIVIGVVLLARSAAPHPGEPAAGGAPRAGDGSLWPDAESPGPRLLIGTDTYPPHVNGAAVFTQRLAHQLAGAGWQVHVVTSGSTRAGGTEREGRVVVHRLPSRPVPFHPELGFSPPWQVARETGRVLAEVRPALVHIQTHYLIGRALSRQAPAAGVPLVATNHFMPDNLLVHVPAPRRALTPLARWAWRDCVRVLNRADVVTTPTETAAGLLRARGLVVEPLALSCGVDLARFSANVDRGEAARQSERGGGDRRPAIVFVGRLDADKRVSDLIDALPLVRRHVDARLVVAGTGSQREELERRARRRGVEPVVEFLGYVPDEELPAVYAAGAVFAMPGIAELQSLVTLEAMATGLPVVAADAVALPHLVRNGHNGFLFPPRDVPALAECLLAVLTDPPQAARMGAASRRLAAEHDMGAATERFAQVYRRLLAPEATPRAPAPCPG